MSIIITAQSESYKTFMNPVIPGDHPDCTLTKIGKDFYTTGSSFNPTPKIYHSTDLVHWEVVAQPVSAAWTNYGDAPAGGCWGGQVVFYNNKYWHFFSRNNTMYFTTANDIKGEWTLPTQMKTPSQVPGLGYDNTIFIDDDGSWYLLVKNGQENNWIVQLGNDGQPAGKILDLRWINPSPNFPYSWAEGPVMWKFKGKYFYSFARNVAGGQKVFVSDKLTDDKNSWTLLGDFFNEGDPKKINALFQNPNHSSAVVTLEDSTHWVIHPLWRNASNNEWYGQGRQGLLNQVRYDANGKPTADYPVNEPLPAPKLPSNGIPWMVPHSDYFDKDKLNPEWSFLGYTSTSTWSLSKKKGWLTLSPKGRSYNTIIKNDAEHHYSLITKVSFEPLSINDQAGLWVINGSQNLFLKLCLTLNNDGNKIVLFNYRLSSYESLVNQNIIYLKLVRVNHLAYGYYSIDGLNWIQVGEKINVSDLDGYQPNYNSWTGNRQGLFVLGNTAEFDFYIYRDAYTPILAEKPANQFGTTTSTIRNISEILDNIHNNDWALYAGVEFGNDEYRKNPDSLYILASSLNAGGIVEVYLDSIDSKTKIAECEIKNTGAWDKFELFKTVLLKKITGNHDVYLKFKGVNAEKLFIIKTFYFLDKSAFTSNDEYNFLPSKFELEQNYPNPFGITYSSYKPDTNIKYTIPNSDFQNINLNKLQSNYSTNEINSANDYLNVSLKIYDILGKEVATLLNEKQKPGTYNIKLSVEKLNLSSGVYFYRLQVNELSQTKKMILIK
ncbi:MAG: family 43 glycosylhydrolase [Melioribacteraceae bacterium]|nr:family 43 glycosylhydrolase [Melioribacteraceae bacterium]